MERKRIAEPPAILVALWRTSKLAGYGDKTFVIEKA